LASRSITQSHTHTHTHTHTCLQRFASRIASGVPLENMDLDSYLENKDLDSYIHIHRHTYIFTHIYLHTAFGEQE
jgi:hypothetical protein